MSDSKERKNLLVVDDEAEITKALRRLFRKKYRVLTAQSGAEGLELLQKHTIPVIISDQRMPGLTGSEFFAQAERTHPDSTRLLVTGFADINAVIDAINNGRIYRYITKPWDPEELQGIVAQAYERYELILSNRRLLRELQEANAVLETRVRERTIELQSANEELARLDGLKDEFLSMAAHDLRNPLGSILGFSELLLDQAEPESRNQRWLSLVQQASRTMLDLVDNLLDISQIAQGRLEVHPETVDLPAYFRNLQDLYQGLAARKGLELRTHIPEAISQARFDPKRIAQVLGNLLANAFKFSYPSTTVEVRAHRFDDVLEIEVADQGQGIPDQELGRIFTRYEQSSTLPSGSERGIGLGLSICQKIVEEHGGHMGVESTLGKGSRFFFRLPGGVLPEGQPSAEDPNRTSEDLEVFSRPPSDTPRRRSNG